MTSTSDEQRSLRGIAPGKINLHLRITGKRDDGYHLIESLVLPIDLTDEIVLAPRDDGRLIVHCPALPRLETDDNLIIKAARWFFRQFDIPPGEQGADIALRKRIPLGAGLGGGSADAATVLRLLEERHGRSLAEAGLLNETWRIGADVAACYTHLPCWVEGIGEIVVEAVELPKIAILLANPGFEVSTRWAYEATSSEMLTNVGNDAKRGRRFTDLKEIIQVLCNDLEAVTFRKHPVLSEMKGALVECGAQAAMMTGSGPTIYGLFDRNEQAQDAKDRLASEWTSWTFWAASNFVG
ncbi:MAG: 4-(cytidine 5'-diphospho)-2-C-methyl-D-erythritol kinase [Myxococcales bacterium]|nr:MAG: 4-(cytidine 5'-diphospho)-2-C-methyl-D-erythritol kinase [Myxococcales bacterium]